MAIDKRAVDRETANFISHMKMLFAKIPSGLSGKEYRTRAERARQIAESLDRQHDKKMEHKKYQLLSQKYFQLAEIAEGRRKPITKQTEAPIQVIEQASPVYVEPKSKFDYFFLIVALFGFVLSGLFFTNIMMDSISGLSRVISNILGVVSAVIGLVFLYFGLLPDKEN